MHVRPTFGQFVTCFLIALALIFGTAETSNAANFYGTADICKFTVTPAASSALTGMPQTVTATISSAGITPIQSGSLGDVSQGDVFDACAFNQLDALEGVGVTFTIVDGPNSGVTGDVPLNATGSASFTYTSAATGTDTVQASLTLPDVCYVDYGEEPVAVDVPAGCGGEIVLPEGGPQADSVSSNAVVCEGPPQVSAVAQDCPTVTMTGSSLITWSAPPVVQQTADPSLAISKFKRCVSHKFKIAPSYSGGALKSSTLFVDGKKTQTRTGSTDPFTINARRYKAGKHNFEVVSVFTSGKAASKFGSFTRCKVRVTQARISPQFTG
jgi:hypothetical protein